MLKIRKVPVSGCMLISQPSLTDRFFSRSVVMLAEYGADGTFGFIVNKPARIQLSTVTKEFIPFEAELYMGGPVQVDTLFFVHNKGNLVEGSLKIAEDVYWGGNIDTVRNLMLAGRMTSRDVRFYAGYSGWEAGQLERELKEKSWIIVDSRKSYVFGDHPSMLWKEIVLSLGSDFAPWVNFPPDPGLN